MLRQGRVVAGSTRVFDLVAEREPKRSPSPKLDLLATAGFRKFVGATGVPARSSWLVLEGSRERQGVWYATRSAGMLRGSCSRQCVVGTRAQYQGIGQAPAPELAARSAPVLGGLAGSSPAVHVVAIVLDSFVSFSVLNVSCRSPL